MADDDDPPRPASQILPIVVFALLVVGLIAGIWVFPRIYDYMAQQDCIASGHTNCVRQPVVQ